MKSGVSPSRQSTTLQSGAEFSPIVPPGAWFAIWGIIYTLLILFAIYQVLPAQRDDAACVAARPYATAALVLNGAWLVVSGNQLYWMALIIIAGYWYFLLKAVDAVDAEERLKRAGATLLFLGGAALPLMSVLANLFLNWATVACSSAFFCLKRTTSSSSTDSSLTGNPHS